MNPVTKHPVYDLDHTLLIEAGTELTPAFMAEFCRGNGNSYELVSLLDYGTVLQDLLHQFSTSPYNLIFSDKGAIATVLGFMGQVALPLPILQIMEYFRKNDFHTYRHMLMISALSTLIIARIDSGEGGGAVESAHLGPFHDLGKFTVPLAVLRKKTPLTRTELDILRHHAVAGYVLISHYFKDHTGLAATIALDHHERRNGSGYSRGIRQHNLMVEVTTVCDIYDALVAQRPYRPISYDNRTALEELTWMAQGGEIGWEAVQVLVACNRRVNGNPDAIKISLERRGKPPEENVYGRLAPQEDADRPA